MISDKMVIAAQLAVNHVRYGLSDSEMKKAIEAALSVETSEPAAYQQRLMDGRWVECSHFVAFGWGDKIDKECRALYAAPQAADTAEIERLSQENAALRGGPKSLADALSDCVIMTDDKRVIIGFETAEKVLTAVMAIDGALQAGKEPAVCAAQQAREHAAQIVRGYDPDFSRTNGMLDAIADAILQAGKEPG